MSKNIKNPNEADHSSDLWALADQLRGTQQHGDLEALLRAAKIPITWQDLYNFTFRFGRGESVIIPPYVTDFISAYIGEKKPQSVLDPWAGVGSLLLPIVEKNSVPKSKGISPIQAALAVARSMDKRSLVEWIQASPRTALDELGTFDLIVSSPPLNLPPIAETFEIGGETIEVRDSETHVLVLKSAKHLSENGEAIFILPNGFFFSAQSASTRAALPKLGLHIKSIIALPAGVCAPVTSIELNLVFVSRQKTDEVFVGQLSPDRNPTPLLENMRKRRTGAVPQLGRLLKLADYRGWNALVTTEEQQRLVELSGLSPVRLLDVVQEVNLADRKNEENPFEDRPNSVYLPLIGTSPAITALTDLKIKPHNYAQLVVNPDKAYASFLAEFFNSTLGRKTRDKLLSGTFIPKINKQNLLTATVYTLPLVDQKTALDVGREIRQLRLTLEQFETQLWRRPIDAGGVQKKLTKLNESDNFEAWVETMPFPLASILWRYRAMADTRSKNEHLLHFFEAATMFLATVMTSAFHSDPQFFGKNKGDWFKKGKKGEDNQYSLAKSNFGQWVHRCYALAKTTRTLLNGKETRDLCLNLYKTYDTEKLTTLSERPIYSTLEKAVSYRNLQAHGGITNEENEIRRLTLLEKELTDLRALLGSVFEDWWLIRPGENKYTKGLYRYTVERLTGTRQVFAQEKVQMTTPTDTEELYLFDTASQQPLQLLHFFRMMPSPKTEEVACYFYNRVEKDGVRWVSYHFERDSEFISADASVLKLIQEVEQNNGQ
jgi:hypothetical protein